MQLPNKEIVINKTARKGVIIFGSIPTEGPKIVARSPGTLCTFIFRTKNSSPCSLQIMLVSHRRNNIVVRRLGVCVRCKDEEVE